MGSLLLATEPSKTPRERHMRSCLLRRIATIATAGSLILIVASPPTQGAVVGSWALDDLAQGAKATPGMTLSLMAGTSSLRASSDTRLTGATSIPGVNRAIYFPGWKRVVNDTVDATESALSTDATLGFAAGSDGASAALDPVDRPFSVAVTILPEPAADFPLAGRDPSAVSPNIIQKGLTSTTGGFWKVSLGMGGSGSSRYWFPFCTFKNGATELKPGYTGSTFHLAQGVPYRLGCLKSGATATLRVSTPGGITLFSTSQSASADFTIDNSIAISVGHKPNSTDPADSYAGSISQVRIDKS